MRAVGSLPYRQAQPAAGGLPAGDFALLAPHLKEVVLEQGAVLQEQGDPVDQVYFPHDGIISLLAVMRQGDAIETATIGYEGAVGSFAGLGQRRSHTRAVVQVAGAATRIAASHFRKAVQDSDAICRIVIRYGEMSAHPGPADRGLQRAACGGGAAEPLAAPGPRPP
jgi:CRP-like cAMP-binding protein